MKKLFGIALLALTATAHQLYGTDETLRQPSNSYIQQRLMSQTDFYPRVEKRNMMRPKRDNHIMQELLLPNVNPYVSSRDNKWEPFQDPIPMPEVLAGHLIGLPQDYLLVKANHLKGIPQDYIIVEARNLPSLEDDILLSSENHLKGIPSDFLLVKANHLKGLPSDYVIVKANHLKGLPSDEYLNVQDNNWQNYLKNYHDKNGLLYSHNTDGDLYYSPKIQ
ncbi:UNKNOWN [Stylonychia lemnae]|uniref:Uncharacterized protein n=1 Tax=Stylonychia lemnae TaxID=5949 RepID=A0A078AVA2_STYLE|nr:UNKNOWN [Stylonychia lemnae]|eukprot:CDW85207.1 UNKNOWN [Stylonychia lemnae]